MNHEQIKVIEQYLKINTNYAIILEGDYGIGKTYFYKEILSPRVKDVKLPDNNKKTYSPIHISLFGVKNIEEIPRLIFLELWPTLKSRKGKIGTSLAKVIARGYMNYRGLGNIEDYIEDIEKDTLYNLNNLLICFDDLDRKSEDLSLAELYGYINSLVENEGAKVLLISNENKIQDKVRKSIKEKVIGIRIQYRPNYKKVFNSILENKYKNDLTYSIFIKKNKELIFEVLTKNNYNFRSLLYFLEHFKIIFSELEANFQTDSEERDLAYKKKDKFKAVLVFSLAISFEYKGGMIPKKDLTYLETTKESKLSVLSEALFVQKLPEEQRSKPELPITYRLRKKYSQKFDFYIFKSIINYFLGISSFNVDDILIELKHKFPQNEDILEPHYILLDNFTRYKELINLKESKYKDLIFDMLRYADQGKYKLTEYSLIFDYATRFNNVQKFDLGNLIDQLKKGAKISQESNKNKYIDNFIYEIRGEPQTNYINERREIIKYCKNLNEQIKEKEEKEKVKELLELFKNDYNKFIHEMKHDSSNRLFPFWKYVSSKDIVNSIKEMKNSEIEELRHHFKSRSMQSNILDEEKENLSSIIENLNKVKKVDRLEDYFINLLITEIENILK